VRWFNRLLGLSEFSSARTSGSHEIRRATELMNPTSFTSFPAQEDRYWDNCVLNTIACIEHLCYYDLINNDLSLRPWRCSRGWTNLNLGRLVMDILHNSDDNQKQCKKSSRVFPATTEYFHKEKGSSATTVK
jgi:hypothetical protein